MDEGLYGRYFPRPEPVFARFYDGLNVWEVKGDDYNGPQWLTDEQFKARYDAEYHNWFFGVKA